MLYTQSACQFIIFSHLIWEAMFEHHICSQSLRLKVLYSNWYPAMAHSIRFLPSTLKLVTLNSLEWHNTL